jgi:hypothetical protein
MGARSLVGFELFSSFVSALTNPLDLLQELLLLFNRGNPFLFDFKVSLHICDHTKTHTLFQ